MLRSIKRTVLTWCEKLILKKIEKKAKERGKKMVWEWKKLVVMVLGAIIGFFGEALGLSPQMTTTVIAILSAYILGQGVADIGKGKEVARIKAIEAGILHEDDCDDVCLGVAPKTMPLIKRTTKKVTRR